jgi:hypothetical protein
MIFRKYRERIRKQELRKFAIIQAGSCVWDAENTADFNLIRRAEAIYRFISQS